MIRKRKLNLILLLILFTTINFSLYSQQVVITLNQLESGTIDHIASEKVSFLPGYSYIPGYSAFGIEKMHAYIDPNQIFPANYLTIAPDAENRDLDYSLPVGTLPGSASVSQSGAANYSISIEVPPGTNGMQPTLSVNYNSQGGNGILGVKWQLGGLSAITRAPRDIYHDGTVMGIQFNSYDKFVLDGNRLVVVGSDPYGGNGTEYHTEIETFSVITSYSTQGIGPTNFTVVTKDGNIVEYGNTDDSRIEAEGRDEVLVWLINKVTDPYGNCMEYFYLENNGQGEYRIDRIEYTKNTANGISNHYNKVQFYYDEREDKSLSYIKESYQKSTKLLRKISTFCEGDLVYTYKFNYHFDFYSHLVEVEKLASDNLQVNSTVFEWGEENPIFFPTPNALATTYDEVVVSDFTGDGYGDAFCQIDNDTWKIYEWDTQTESFGQLSVGYNLPENIKQILPGDFNGDGIIDLLIPYKKSIDNWVYICLFIGNGSNFTPIYFNVAMSSSLDPVFSVGDFNADGKTDIFRAHKSGIYSSCYLWELNTSANLLEEIATELTEPIVKFYVRDFNGDKRDDFLFIFDNSSSLMTLYPGSPYLNEMGSLGYPTKWHSIFPGDFNGDGNCDILTYSNSSWGIGICDGNSFVSNLIPTPPITNTIDPNSDPEDDNYFVLDMNGDGKADIFESIEISSNFHQKSIYTFDGENWHQDGEIYQYAATEMSKFQFSDINGDGSVDAFCKIGNSDFYGTLTFHPYENKHSITHVSNGLDIKTELIYRPITDAEVYTKGSGANYPIIDVVLPLWVVSQLNSENSISSNNTMIYNYEGAKLHQQGRGLLGFSKVKSTNQASGIIQTTEYSINEDKYYPFQIYSKKEINSNPIQLISDATITNTEFKEFQSVFNCNSFMTLVTESNQNNYDKGTSITYNLSYDGYANMISKTSTVLNGNSAEWQYNTVYSNYTNEGSFYPNKPGYVISTSNNMSLPNLFTSQVNYYYNTIGAVESIVVNLSDPLQIGTQFEYNGLGKVVTSTGVVSGLSNRVSINDYDDKGRFLISTINPEGHVSYSEYDPKDGNVISTTDPNGQSIIMEYNSLGLKIKQILPTGQEELYISEWNSVGGSTPGCYTLLNSLEGFGTQKSIHNKLGQILRNQEPGFNGQLLEDFEYNSLGQLVQKSLPYYIGLTPEWISYTYGDRGEVLAENYPSNNYTFSYNNLSTTITETNLSNSTTTLRDAIGNVTYVNDIGSNTIEYSYNNQGLNVDAIVNGDPLTTVSKEYDNNGNVTLVSDPNADVTEYTYNSYGEILSQSAPNSIDYSFNYDKLGRLILRSNLNGEITVFNYDNSPNGVGLISSINYNNNVISNFDYDNYSRLVSSSESMDGNVYTSSYLYNSNNQLIQETYPSGFQIENVYNNNGFLSQIQKINGGVLWNCSHINQFGLITDFELGNGYSTENEFSSLGALSGMQTYDQNLDNTQDLYFDFSNTTGNLSVRADLKNTLTEYFTYDISKSKLTSSQVGSAIPINCNYNDLGNITSKSDAGDYTYDQTKIHAVTGISGNNGTIPSLNQTILFNDFNKVSNINEDNMSLNFVYGHDRNRRKTQLYNNSILQNTKYYFGNYEKEINELSGVVKEYHYLSSPSGIFAVLTKSTGQNDQIRYIHKDHLGSIQSISDELGNLMEEYSFDAWGRQRNSDYWNYDNIPDLPDFGRGFTGHEHLTEFGLINMNGRLYDPVLGRMLSPDNFIQDPANSQNYNRYSYCLNNPLKYKDPSGELYLIDDLIVGGVSFLGGYTYSGIKTGDWGWSSAKTGAIWSATSLLALNTMGASLSPALAATVGGQMVASNIVSDISPSLSIPFGNYASINISPTIVFGSNQAGIGINTSFNAHLGDFNVSTGIIASGYGNNFGPGGFSTEVLNYWSNGYDNGIWGLSNTTCDYSSGETSQLLGAIGVRVGEFSMTYQNDFMFGLQADGGDRYRTAAAKISWGNISAGVNLFTGDPGLIEGDREFVDGTGKYHTGKKVYTSGKVNKYRAGIAYLGYNNIKFGINSEKVRHIAQNRFAHDFITNGRAKHFKVLNINPTGYFSIGTKNLYSLW